MVCDVGATLLDVGSLGISWGIEQATGYGGADVCEGVGDVVDGAVAGGSELVNLGASGLHAGWDYGSAGAERAWGWATDLADETVDWVLTGLTGEWKCPIVHTGGTGSATSWSSGPGLPAASAGSTAYDAVLAATGGQGFDALARCLVPLSNTLQNSSVRLNSAHPGLGVHTYGADGTVIGSPSLDVAQWSRSCTRCFFKSMPGDSGCRHAGHNEGFVVALERATGAAAAVSRFVAAESWNTRSPAHRAEHDT